MEFEFVNDIPADLDSTKQYTTEVVSATWVKGNILVKLRFIGEEYNRKDPQCLFPLSKDAHNEDTRTANL